MGFAKNNLYFLKHLNLTKIRVKLSYNADINVWGGMQITLGKSLVSWVDVTAAQFRNDNYMNVSGV